MMVAAAQSVAHERTGDGREVSFDALPLNASAVSLSRVTRRSTAAGSAIGALARASTAACRLDLSRAPFAAPARSDGNEPEAARKLAVPVDECATGASPTPAPRTTTRKRSSSAARLRAVTMTTRVRATSA